jgi:septal ring factor EnvC (AmiA/AmiB activator)
MKRLVFAAAALLALALPGRASAQEETVAQTAYRTKREQLMKELDETQQRLADIRGQRVQLQSRIESVIASMLQQRAQALLLSNEANALQQLDAILTSSQDNLLAQRDRFTATSDAVRRRTGAVLVVLLRADSSAAQTRGPTTLTVDNAPADSRTYSTAANGALQLGAVDQLYRANILPTPHTVTVNVTVNGQPVTQTITVNAAGEAVTYVQFAVRNGQVTGTTWSSRGTTPF